jgi:hypothetical protein
MREAAEWRAAEVAASDMCSVGESNGCSGGADGVKVILEGSTVETAVVYDWRGMVANNFVEDVKKGRAAFCIGMILYQSASGETVPRKK